MNSKKEPYDILSDFSKDAYPIMTSYLNKVDTIIMNYTTDLDQKALILEGIFDFINEFMEPRIIPLSIEDTHILIDLLSYPPDIAHIIKIAKQSIELA